jgi:hypothetical protein
MFPLGAQAGTELLQTDPLGIRAREILVEGALPPRRTRAGQHGARALRVDSTSAGFQSRELVCELAQPFSERDASDFDLVVVVLECRALALQFGDALWQVSQPLAGRLRSGGCQFFPVERALECRLQVPVHSIEPVHALAQRGSLYREGVLRLSSGGSCPHFSDRRLRLGLGRDRDSALNRLGPPGVELPERVAQLDPHAEAGLGVAS